MRYLHLDHFIAGVVGYARYRYEATKCFFSGPRLGHPWESNGMESRCSRCPKTFHVML